MAWVHLSRWTRIGIAASVIWFVVFGGYLFVTWSGELQDSYQRRLHECYQTLSFTLQSDDLRQPKGASEFKNCIADVRLGDLGLKNLLYLVLLDIGTIILGWIAVMSIISVIRWNKKGAFGPSRNYLSSAAIDTAANATAKPTTAKKVTA